MLSSVKFVPREQLKDVHHQEDDSQTSKDDNMHSRRHHRSERGSKKSKKSHHSEEEGTSFPLSRGFHEDGVDIVADMEQSRREAGLDWMLRSAHGQEAKAATHVNEAPKDSRCTEDAIKANPRELNPYLKDDAGGYPTEASPGRNQLLRSSLVGDGGASWRFKALKRAKEQAAREGKKLDEVVEERWGSLGHLAVSVGVNRAAPAWAHLHAIKDRKKVVTSSSTTVLPDQKDEDTEKVKVDYESSRRSTYSRHSEMRKPKSYSWQNEKYQQSREDKSLVSEAISNLNKFSNDGSFIEMFGRSGESKDVAASGSIRQKDSVEEDCPNKDSATEREHGVHKNLNPNQLAADAFRLRLKGKHEEAGVLMKRADDMKQKHTQNTIIGNLENRGRRTEMKLSCKRGEEDADFYLAHKIAKNKQFNISKQADDEYDFDDDNAPTRKGNRKQTYLPREGIKFPNQLMTQKERCQFCFENSTRPKHLVVAIAQFSYMTLPPWQPVVQGHCCILPMHHEFCTRNVDDNVWEELRNFKKCLIMMFDKQDKDLIFLETVVDLAKQQRHCLVECIPLPRDIAKEAPLYFKKAIDEAEDEWSQHNSKKLIRTSREKGLRRSIPKDFPYFHVEFGLDEGFVHVIDDDRNFKGCLGLNVIRGMLRLPEEDMHRRRRQEAIDKQRVAVAAFTREWEPFDWTKQLS